MPMIFSMHAQWIWQIWSMNRNMQLLPMILFMNQNNAISFSKFLFIITITLSNNINHTSQQEVPAVPPLRFFGLAPSSSLHDSETAPSLLLTSIPPLSFLRPCCTSFRGCSRDYTTTATTANTELTKSTTRVIKILTLLLLSLRHHTNTNTTLGARSNVTSLLSNLNWLGIISESIIFNNKVAFWRSWATSALAPLALYYLSCTSFRNCNSILLLVVFALVFVFSTVAAAIVFSWRSKYTSKTTFVLRTSMTCAYSTYSTMEVASLVFAERTMLIDTSRWNGHDYKWTDGQFDPHGFTNACWFGCKLRCECGWIERIILLWIVGSELHFTLLT